MKGGGRTGKKGRHSKKNTRKEINTETIFGGFAYVIMRGCVKACTFVGLNKTS